MPISAADEEARRLYHQVLVELKIRAEAINQLTQVPHIAPLFVLREASWLQLRIMCELIAIACLIAHGDLTSTRKLKAYKPAEIIAQLEPLNPHFFPRPVRFIIDPGRVHIEEVPGDHMTKQELIALWNQSGDILHRSGVKDLRSSPNRDRIGVADINHWGQRMLDLMGEHVISRAGHEFHILAGMSWTELGGAVDVHIAAVQPDPI